MSLTEGDPQMKKFEQASSIGHQVSLAGDLQVNKLEQVFSQGRLGRGSSRYSDVSCPGCNVS